MPIPALPASSTQVCIYFFPLFNLFNFLYRSKCQCWHCRRHQCRYIYIFFLFFIYLISCIEVNANAGTAGAINAGIYIFFFLLFYLLNSLSRSEHQCRYVFFFSSFFICLIPCIEVNANSGTAGVIDAGMYLFIFFFFIFLIPCIVLYFLVCFFFFSFFLFV